MVRLWVAMSWADSSFCIWPMTWAMCRAPGEWRELMRFDTFMTTKCWRVQQPLGARGQLVPQKARGPASRMASTWRMYSE